jgi:glycosyltransferase involved in cell wall biosynthesis
MVEDGLAALLVPVGFADAMGEAAVRVLTEPELVGALRENGLRASMDYAWPAVRERWFEVYRSVVANNEDLTIVGKSSNA